MNVLLVDDEPLELEQLEFLLKPLFPSWVFFKAYDGIEALAFTEKARIDIAFLDINLPGKSGLKLGETLKLQNKDIDIIIVTAYQDLSYAKQSIRLGAIDYITKPITENDLHYTLKKYPMTRLDPHYSNVIKESIRIIQENHAEKLSLADLAVKVHINPTYLSRRFHEEVGSAFSDYLTRYRIEKAKDYLLQHPDWSISLVAERAGFSCQQYFSAIFKRLNGKTPMQYREKGK